ncbi:MAG: transposase [Chroococcus sp. CMT-3BRIN-NPC107]|jgi:transposase-like protein|nr:transposase [Chroococcus sp. CMT-3BRIN-NPC107]
MTGKKISESIKNDIIHLYKHTGETTSTLAERYGVSNSTISRMLKNTLPEQEYEVLIASKRAARVPGTEGAKQLLASSPTQTETIAEVPIELKPSLQLEEPSTNPTPIIKRRSIISREEKLPVAVDDSSQLETISTLADDRAQLTAKSDRPTLITQNSEINFKVTSSPEQLETKNLNFPIDEETNAIVAEMLGEDMLTEAEDSEGLEDLDDLDDEEDELTRIVKRRSSSNVLIQVLPLSEANLPKTCYLVIDRLSELITRPLKEFGDLGQIPAHETNQKTLPIFDNHRVARRFSTKRDRVIKVPDSKMLQKTCPHLQAKGITRLLVDGQVYSLHPS